LLLPAITYTVDSIEQQYSSLAAAYLTGAVRTHIVIHLML